MLATSTEGSVARPLHTTKITCKANNAMADSINANTMDRNLLLPVADKIFSYKTGSTSQYTLTILNRIKPVTRAFTAKDMAKLVETIDRPHLAFISWLFETDSELRDVNQIAEGSKFEFSWGCIVIEDKLTHVCMPMSRVKEWSRRGCYNPIQSSNGRSFECFDKWKKKIIWMVYAH